MKTYVFWVALCLQGYSGIATSSDSSNSVTFTETSESGHIVRELAFSLTDKPGHACIGGKWKKALPIKDPLKYAKDPVYKMEDGKFEMLLINGFCDSYDSYIGQFVDGNFKGEHINYGWGSKTLGNVTGSQLK